MSNPSCSNKDNIGALIFNRSRTFAAMEMAATPSTVQRTAFSLPSYQAQLLLIRQQFNELLGLNLLSTTLP